MKSRIALAAASLITLAGSAHAEPRRHDGFYLRVGVGGGAALGAMTGTTGSDSTAGAIASELALLSHSTCPHRRRIPR